MPRSVPQTFSVRAALWADLLFLTLLTLAGLLLRLDFLVANEFVIDSDEAIVGLMGKHILEGHGIPAFYYGQHYMGSLEAIVAAGAFALFGVSSVALKAVPLVFSLVLVWIQYALGFLCGGRGVARIAALLLAIPPSALVIWSSMARGGFIEVMVIGSLALLLALSAFRNGVTTARLIGTGFLMGLGWWVNNQIVYFAVPVGGALLLAVARNPGAVRALAVAAVSFFVGSLPFWRYNLEHHFASTGLFRLAAPFEILGHVQGLVSTALPILVGAQRFWAEEAGSWILTGLAILAYGLLAVITLIERRRSLTACALAADPRLPRVTLLLTLMVGFTCAVFVVSSFGYLVQAPRYLLPLYVPLFLLIGLLLSRFAQKARFPAQLILLLFLSLHLASSYVGGRAIPGEPFVAKGERVAKDHSELLHWLRDHNITFVRTNYWIGYRLAFETQERTRFLMYQDPHYVRIASYEKEGGTLPEADVPYVLVPAQADIVRLALRAAGYQFQETTLSGYHVFTRVAAPFTVNAVSPAALSPSATLQGEKARFAIDGDATSRWGTGHPQTPGMEFQLDAPTAPLVCGLEYDISGWPQDVPRRFELARTDDQGQSEILITPEEFAAIRYFMDDRSRYAFYFDCKRSKRITLRQLGSDPVFDWSVGELTLWTRKGDAL